MKETRATDFDFVVFFSGKYFIFVNLFSYFTGWKSLVNLLHYFFLKNLFFKLHIFYLKSTILPKILIYEIESFYKFSFLFLRITVIWLYVSSLFIGISLSIFFPSILSKDFAWDNDPSLETNYNSIFIASQLKLTRYIHTIYT